MVINVFSTSESFNQYIKKVSNSEINCYSKLLTISSTEDINLIHSPSIGEDYEAWIKNKSNKKFIICADRPSLVDMLSAVKVGAKAYCNSYMQEVHYQQMFRLVADGQSWFPPQMLEETFKLAAQTLNKNNKTDEIKELTEKEKQISFAIAKGYSNQKVAAELDITESTVKTHLTHIYKKLDLKDRVALVIHMTK